MTKFAAKLKNKLSHIITATRLHNNSYTLGFFRIINPHEKELLEELIDEKPHIKVYDTIQSQLREFIKSASPGVTYTEEEVSKNVERHLGGITPHEYGVWVYYPWNENLVHILDEQEFVELRTNRNKYKITDEEEDRLSLKKIGVIGLSVGQSVSLTLAMERSFGELRIADYDELEITNLNRLRSGIHNMGIKKTVLVAREIAEIDPFLKVTCFHEGITDSNMESFLLDNGKLDVLIDECDSVDIKIKCRIAAKNHRIPVLMEASDRGTIDIERFDLEPDRPILHGFVEHLDISKVKGLKTMEEKLPYILPIVGIETMSTRLKASAVEVGQSISTWPQLASAVTMGGGLTADICRKVLLDQLHQSGRYFIDIDELISDPQPPDAVYNYETDILTKDKIIAEAALIKPVHVNDVVIDENTIKKLVEAAALAPSAGNNQPWKWYFDGLQLFLFHEIERSVSYGDFKNMASYMALGTAIENLTLKASELGLRVEKQFFPSKEKSLMVASFQFKKDKHAIPDKLIDYINIRFTNRHAGRGGKIDEEAIERMHASVSQIEGCELKFIQDQNSIEKLADIAGKSEKLRLFIPQGHYDLFEKEIRWTRELAEETRDGLDIRTLELSVKDTVGFKVIRDPKAMQLVAEWNGGKVLENMTANLVRSSSAVGLISMPEFNPVNCLIAGQAAERVWLTANKYGISFQPVLAPILHFARLKHGHGVDMPENIQKEFKKLHEEFDQVFGKTLSGTESLFLFRLCFAEMPKVRSLRLSLSDIYISSTK
ncbi:MAG TPA: Rv1355c family protein [Sphingobacteriaceae bacterium]|nr:Rv1355c family protein [Sphingobacteriaceae bacterium]